MLLNFYFRPSLAIMNHKSAINQKLDLAIATFVAHCRDPNNPNEVATKQCERELFGFILTGSDKTFPIDGNCVIHPKLKEDSKFFEVTCIYYYFYVLYL